MNHPRLPSSRRRPEKSNYIRDYHHGPDGHQSDSPRKRQRPRSKPVFVTDIRVPFEEIADFMNRVMHVEGFTIDEGRKKDPDGDEAHVGRAVVHFEQRRNNAWRVEAATDALADKLCYMNRIPFNNTIIRICPDRYISENKCKYSCWNEYFFKRYGRNDNILDSEVFVQLKFPIAETQRLHDFLNERMKFHDLCEFKDHEPIRHVQGMICLRSFLLRMGTPDEANRLCFLNGIQLGNNPLRIVRPSDWIGPKPRFSTYLEFLRARSSDSNAEKGNHRSNAKPCAFAERPEQEMAVEHQTSSSSKEPEERRSIQSTTVKGVSSNAKSPDPEKAPRELARDSDAKVQAAKRHDEEAKKLEKDSKQLQIIFNVMKHSRDTKVKEIVLLKSQLHDLEIQVANKKSEASALQDAESNLKNEIALAQEKVNAVHGSWQAQALVLVEKQQEMDGIQEQLVQLSRDAQNVKESLLDERNECQDLETVLKRFASEPLSLAVVKKQQRGNATGIQPAVIASSDDNFDV